MAIAQDCRFSSSSTAAHCLTDSRLLWARPVRPRGSDPHGRLLPWLLQPPPLLSLAPKAAASLSTPTRPCLLEHQGFARTAVGVRAAALWCKANGKYTEQFAAELPFILSAVLLASTLPSPSQQG